MQISHGQLHERPVKPSRPFDWSNSPQNINQNKEQNHINNCIINKLEREEEETAKQWFLKLGKALSGHVTCQQSDLPAFLF